MRAAHEEPLPDGTAQGSGYTLINSTDSIAEHDAGRKSWATAQAEAARAGCTLHRLEGGGFLVGRWSLCREFPDLPGAMSLVRQIVGVSS